jgi:hypothetical protein
MNSRKKMTAEWTVFWGFWGAILVGLLVFHTLRSQLVHLRGLPDVAARNIGVGFGLATFLVVLLLFVILGVTFESRDRIFERTERDPQV